jgi:hypothetical protein
MSAVLLLFKDSIAQKKERSLKDRSFQILSLTGIEYNSGLV